MIQRFSDHSANERTFLAWVRTGISVIAFGFVVEKFNLFIATIAGAVTSEVERQIWTRRLASPFGRLDGVILMLVGIVLIVIAALRFVRTARLIDSPDPRPSGVQAEVGLAAVLALLAAAFCAYLVLS